jgi:SAM-dependent methyltransferase
MAFADELRLAWHTISVQQMLRKVILEGIFRYDPALGEALLARIETGVAGLAPSVELYDDLHQFLKRPENAASFQKLFQGDEAARIQRRIGQLVKLLPAGWKPTGFVDVGCGTGLVAAGLARHWELPPGRVFGVEVFERSQAGDAFTRLPFADRHVPLPDATQDLALLIMVLHHEVDQLGLLREVFRVLRPGGRLIVRETDAFRVDLRLFNQVMEMMYYRVFNQLPGIPNPVLHRSAAEWEFDFDRIGFVPEKIERPEPNSPFTPVHYLLLRPGEHGASAP